MDNSIQAALQNLIKNQATPEEIELLQQAFSSGEIFIGGNVRNSVIIVGIGNTVELDAETLERLTAANNRSSLHQLPQPPTDFVGREQELKKILKSLDRKSGAAISGLVGMGGIGKTALGLVAAHGLIGKYSEAQFFIDLRGTGENPLKALDVMKHIVQSVYPTADLRNATEDELAGAYQSVLREKKSILFLDNAHNAAQVAPLRPPADCFMLVTSRWHFTVPGLQPVKLDVLKEKDAIRLLVEICPRLAKTQARQIARLCGYLPIALRLAASYLSVHTAWTAEEYIAHLSDKSKRLASLSLEGIEINIAVSFEQSYQQLMPNEQRYWTMLAVFPASFKRDALASLWDIDDEATRRLVDKLCQYSLLDYDPAIARYHLHDLLSDFASTKLIEVDRETAQLNHLRHYRDVWFAAEDLYTKGGESITNGLSLFDAEFAHIESAYRWAEEHATANQNLWSVLKEIPEFVYLGRLRLHFNRQIAWFRAVLVAAQKLEDQYNQNKALGNIGIAYKNLGEYRKAIEYYEQALEIAHEMDDRQRQGTWLGSIGVACANLGENHKAIEYYEQALEIAREIGDHRNQGLWLGNIGVAYRNLEEYRKAMEYYEQALEIAREIGDRQNQGLWLGNIGSTYNNLGENHKAIEYYKQALEIAREMGDRQRQGIWIGNIGEAYRDLGESDKASEHLTQALEIAREIGHQQIECESLISFGELYIRTQRNEKAKESLESALTIAKKLGLRGQEANGLFNFAKLFQLENNREMALQHAQDARAIFETIESPKLAEVTQFIESLNQAP